MNCFMVKSPKRCTVDRPITNPCQGSQTAAFFFVGMAPLEKITLTPCRRSAGFSRDAFSGEGVSASSAGLRESPGKKPLGLALIACQFASRCCKLTKCGSGPPEPHSFLKEP